MGCGWETYSWRHDSENRRPQPRRKRHPTRHIPHDSIVGLHEDGKSGVGETSKKRNEDASIADCELMMISTAKRNEESQSDGTYTKC
jgi:hypothetical protein